MYNNILNKRKKDSVLYKKIHCFNSNETNKNVQQIRYERLKIPTNTFKSLVFNSLLHIKTATYLIRKINLIVTITFVTNL